jgi:hypothetical protein
MRPISAEYYRLDDSLLPTIRQSLHVCETAGLGWDIKGLEGSDLVYISAEIQLRCCRPSKMFNQFVSRAVRPMSISLGDEDAQLLCSVLTSERSNEELVKGRKCCQLGWSADSSGCRKQRRTQMLTSMVAT